MAAFHLRAMTQTAADWKSWKCPDSASDRRRWEQQLPQPWPAKARRRGELENSSDSCRVSGIKIAAIHPLSHTHAPKIKCPAAAGAAVDVWLTGAKTGQVGDTAQNGLKVRRTCGSGAEQGRFCSSRSYRVSSCLG